MSQAEEAWKKYDRRLFLKESELFEYARTTSLGDERTKRDLTAYILKEVRKYKRPIDAPRRMTIAGYYISEDEYRDLV